jgi:hypothetical protein
MKNKERTSPEMIAQVSSHKDIFGIAIYNNAI